MHGVTMKLIVAIWLFTRHINKQELYYYYYYYFIYSHPSAISWPSYLNSSSPQHIKAIYPSTYQCCVQCSLV